MSSIYRSPLPPMFHPSIHPLPPTVPLPRRPPSHLLQVPARLTSLRRAFLALALAAAGGLLAAATTTAARRKRVDAARGAVAVTASSTAAAREIRLRNSPRNRCIIV